jgi:hypothetical protein
MGSTGDAVRELQDKLLALHFDPGDADGTFGQNTRFALWAFQKTQGLEPTGVVDAATKKALSDPRPPAVLVPDGPADRVEVSIKTQLLTVYVGGELKLVSHISTGSGKSYCVEGDCSKATTPKGDFATSWRVNGWRTSRLGQLFNPVYFHGGIAVHGYPSVPLHPASHGCVRIPMHTATIFPGLVGTGEAVYVR